MNEPGRQFESEYNLRERHPDFENFFARWQRESDEARKILACHLDQRYGDGPNMTLDISPLSGSLRPILIFFHGGYWRVMDKEQFAFPAIGLNESGVLFVSINYALAPSVSLDDIVEQCRQAVIWVYRNAEKYGGDARRIHVSGHSAGGHLTAMLLSTDWTQRGLPATLLAGGITISGIFDLIPLLQTSINDDVRLDRESARRNSPMEFPPANGPPLISAVGADETDEFLRQSREYAEAWQDNGGIAQYLPLEGFHHFDVICELGRSGSALNNAVLAQIGK